MAKPKQVTIVRAVPLILGGAFCATKVEKSGESKTTTAPQNNRNKTKTIGEAMKNQKMGITGTAIVDSLTRSEHLTAHHCFLDHEGFMRVNLSLVNFLFVFIIT